MTITNPLQPGSTLQKRLQNLNSLLLIPFAFVLPMWIAPTNILAVFIALLWLVRGNYRDDFEKIRGNKLVWALVAFWLLHVIGLLWTTNLGEGPNKVARASLFLFVPVFMMVLKHEHVEAVIWAFLASMLLSCFFSFLIYFQVDPNHFRINDQGDPILFMSRIYYPLYLVIAIAFSLYYLLFDPRSGMGIKMLAGIVAALLTFDLFICNGRAGQMIFFLMVAMAIFQYFGKSWLRASVIFLITVPLLSALAYTTIKPFRERAELAVADVVQFHDNKATSLGQRFVWAKNSFDVFLEHPFFGVGTGDFEYELEKIQKHNNPEIKYDVDPHNMFLLEMGQFGVFGLISLMSILVTQISIALRSAIPLQKYLGLSLPVMFGAIMMSDIYLQLHFTAMLFIFVSSIVYRTDEQRVQDLVS